MDVILNVSRRFSAVFISEVTISAMIRAIASGDWKLVSHWPLGWELYDLAKDRTELQDIAARATVNRATLAALSVARTRTTYWPSLRG